MSNPDNILNSIIKDLSALDEVQAIALGGSRATGKADDKSDYDIYVYVNKNIENNFRQNILSPYCSYMEIGNSYWELEDNCILSNGTYLDIIYRNISDFGNIISEVVEKNLSRNGYTTCLWHNLITSKIVFDKDNVFEKIVKHSSIPYPLSLKKNIIKRNYNLLTASITSYDKQIEKAVKRNDLVNVNNRITAFLDSYFDIIFALNEVKNTGEKRLVETCLEQCKTLPDNFESNIKSLLSSSYNDIENVSKIIKEILSELDKIIRDI